MSSNIDQDFVEYIVKSLVSKPDQVVIERRIDEKGVLLELTVDPEDLGRIIGKRGATAQSLRTLLRALGTKNDARYNLKIVDNGPEDYEKPVRSSAPAQTSAGDDDDASDNASQDSTDEVSRTDDDVIETSDNDNDDESDEKTESDMARKTRRELEDLDDLDI